MKDILYFISIFISYVFEHGNIGAENRGKCWALSKEASSTIFIMFIVFGITRPGIEPTSSRTPGKRSTTGPTDAVYMYV